MDISILFMHLSINRYLGCFHFFGCNVPMNIHVQVFVQTCFQFSWVHTQEWNCWVVFNTVSLFEELSNCFPQWLYHFTFPPARDADSNFSTTSPTLTIVCHFHYSHPSRYEEVSQYGFFSPHTAQHVGFQFPYQRVNPHPLQWKLRVLTTGPPGKSFIMAFFSILFLKFLLEYS